jgi:hypothetical protein
MAAKDAKTGKDDSGWIYTLLGYNRRGRLLWLLVLALAIPGVGVWQIELPRLRFKEPDERLFKAARHGDVAGIEHALAEGADVNAQAPVDRKTALFRAVSFGQADAVRALLKHGANAAARSLDDKTPLEFAEDIRKEEQDPARQRGLDQAIAALREAQR